MSSLYLDWPNLFKNQGGDLRASASGSLMVASGSTLATQKLVRFLLNNPREVQSDGEVLPPDYIYAPDLGEGLTRKLGDSYSDADLHDMKATILQGCAQIDEIATVPPPQVTVTAVKGGVKILITYWDAQSNRPQSIGFTLPS